MSLASILYDEDAAGKYIGGTQSPISTRTLQRWRLEGVGPTYVKLGRLVRYRQTDLNSFLEERTRTSTSMDSSNEVRRLSIEEASHV
jgi:hypothetical protein